MIERTNKWKLQKAMLIGISIIFIIPSIVYFFINGKSAILDSKLEFQYLLTENVDREIQAIVFAIIVTTLVISYYFVIKNRKKIFKEMKEIYFLILIISSIFIFAMPFWCSDIYYYLGIGRLASTYGQNPYYIDMKGYINNNNLNIEHDTVMQAGYKNYWSNTTVVYGAAWTIICSVVSFFSFGNLNVGILIFKILNTLIHVGNCILMYKISKRKTFPLLYGLNPFILIEGIANVHNDLFVVFFILLAIYEVYNKKRLGISLMYLAIATDIKYIAVLLLPLIIIYHFKDESIKVRTIKCLKFGGLFLGMVIIPYLLYFRDFEVFKGLITQQQRYAKGLYCLITVYFPKHKYIAVYVHNISKYIFLFLYTYICTALLLRKDIKFKVEMRKIFLIMMVFLFFMITNFQPWYFIWLSAFMIWQKAKNIKLIVQMQVLMLFANIVFLVYSESYIYVKYYFYILVVGIFICYIKNSSKKIKITLNKYRS